jgi:hypothetical protein
MALLIWHFIDLFPTPKGELAPRTPQQDMIAPGTVASWDHLGYHFTPLAHYDIQARILDKSWYFLDRPSAISPLDLALGWGGMSDPKIYGKMTILQSFRWYWYFWSGEAPLAESEIASSSANTHIIPADSAVRNKLFWLRAGDAVDLTGYLVEVSGPNEFTWRSSLSRTDTGDGACEVMWVESVKKTGR